MQSAFLTLSKNDFVRGLVVAVISAVLTTILQWLDVPGFQYADFQWGLLLKVAITAGIAYIGKNALTTKQGDFMGVKGL